MRTTRGSTAFWLAATLLASLVASAAIILTATWAFGHVDTSLLRVLLWKNAARQAEWLHAFFVLNGTTTLSLVAVWFAYGRYNRALGPLLDVSDDHATEPRTPPGRLSAE